MTHATLLIVETDPDISRPIVGYILTAPVRAL
jgi:hypothetical protein